MTAYILVSTYLVLIAITAANARAADPPKGAVIDQQIRAAQACQRALHAPLFPRRISPWALEGHDATKVLRLWQRRLAECQGRRAVVAKLNAGLAGTPMKGTGIVLERAGWREHVHPAFMAAVAGVESAWGRLYCQRFNAWGLGSCPLLWHPPTFRSWAEAYDYYARFLRDRWPSARKPSDFHGYCRTPSGADCPTWPSSVAWNMDRLGFPPTVTYP